MILLISPQENTLHSSRFLTRKTVINIIFQCLHSPASSKTKNLLLLIIYKLDLSQSIYSLAANGKFSFYYRWILILIGLFYISIYSLAANCKFSCSFEMNTEFIGLFYYINRGGEFSETAKSNIQLKISMTKFTIVKIIIITCYQECKMKTGQ